MKARTKKRVLHILTKKKLVKKQASKTVLRTFLVTIASVSLGILTYTIIMTKPTISVAVHSTAAGGVKIEAPIAFNPTPAASAFGAPANSGRGSWYAIGLPAPDDLTCASRTYPRGSYIHVTNLYNGRSVICRVNDFGPEVWTGRIIDLSRGSFLQVDTLSRGVIQVELRPAAGPTGIIHPTETDISTLVGYALCDSTHSMQFCEQHRQD